MRIDIFLIVIYAAVIIAIITRFDRSPKKRPRITGRGGDFE